MNTTREDLSEAPDAPDAPVKTVKDALTLRAFLDLVKVEGQSPMPGTLRAETRIKR